MREGIANLIDAHDGGNAELLTFYLARMGMRAGDTDAVGEAARRAGKIAETAIGDRFVATLARWFSGIASADAREVASAAEALQSDGWRVLAADAFADAGLLAERQGLPEGREWSAAARERYATASAVPVLDVMRSRVP